jgi:hypothetical protein
MDHMNLNYGTDYATEPALDAIDDFIAPIKREIPWGYSIPYALSGKFGLHRTYAEYLMGKNRLKAKDIQRILSMVDRDHIEMFDEQYIENLYRRYRSVAYDDGEAVASLTAELKGKRVVIICPGSSIVSHQDQIRAVIDETDACVISVNFIPGFFSWSNTLGLGKTVSATPNGRKAFEAINHGANPNGGFRRDGAVSAMCNSIGMIQPGYGNCAPVQLEFDPGIVNDDEGIDKMVAMIRTIMNTGNTLLNINIIDAEKILEAHRDPFKYPDLVVRVTGFTAFFAMLSPEFRQLVVDRVTSVNTNKIYINKEEC